VTRHHPALDLYQRVPLGAVVLVNVGRRRGQRGRVVEQRSDPRSEEAITGRAQYVVEVPGLDPVELVELADLCDPAELAKVPTVRLDLRRFEFRRVTRRALEDAERAGRQVQPSRVP